MARLVEIQRQLAATLKPTRRGCKGGTSRRQRDLRRDPTSGRIVGQVREGGGGELALAETANEATEMVKMKKDDKDEETNEDDDDDTGAGGKSTKMTGGACVAGGEAVELRGGSQQLTQELTQKTERPSRRGGADPGTKTYDNPLLHVDEDEEFEYAEDDDGVMVVARTPHRKGERPSLKAATARALAAEEKIRELQEKVQGLQELVKGEYQEKAEELEGYGGGDDYHKVVILDMALDFARVRLKTAERELKEMEKKLKVAGEEKLRWKKRGEEAEAKLRIRVGEREARVVGAVEIATVQAEVEEARDETEEWKGRAEEAEAKLEERERERERERGEFEEKVAGIERQLAKVDVMEEEMERLKKEAGKEAKGAAKACKLLASVTVDRDRLVLELDQAKIESFREGFEKSWRSAQGAADYRPGHRAGGRAVQDQVRAPHAVNDQWQQDREENRHGRGSQTWRGPW